MDVRRASAADLPGVLAVLDDAAGWLHRGGVEQWPRRFSADALRPAIEEGEVYLAVDGDRPAGTFSLVWADPVIWGDCHDEHEAGYVHQLAVHREWAGRRLGAALLDVAGALVAGHGRRWLRLHCVAHNGRLRRYYEATGFAHRGDLDHLPAVHPTWHAASRYQRPAVARRSPLALAGVEC